MKTAHRFFGVRPDHPGTALCEAIKRNVLIAQESSDLCSRKAKHLVVVEAFGGHAKFSAALCSRHWSAATNIFGEMIHDLW